MSNIKTGQTTENTGHVDGTSSRAHATSGGMSQCPTGHILAGQVGAGRDTSASRPSVPPAASWTSLDQTVDLTPWPNYDESGRVWWAIRVTGSLGRFTLGWCSTLGRFGDTVEVTRLKRKSKALLADIETHVRAKVGPRPMTWLHIAALNLIADHDAGIAVSPIKLEAARKLVTWAVPVVSAWVVGAVS